MRIQPLIGAYFVFGSLGSGDNARAGDIAFEFSFRQLADNLFQQTNFLVHVLRA
jgi:hypothetical protein